MEDYSVQVISREIVKPSSEVHKDHPKTLKLSYLDQLVSYLYVPFVLFYQANESISISNHVQISQKLKHSLSVTLATFYPLAGRVNDEDNTVIDCNDAGIEFIEARAHAQLVDALESLDEYKSKQYVPSGAANHSSTLARSENPFLFVQTTFFDCGGIALGICYSHVFADGNSIMMFINAWASVCRSEEISQMVSFDLATHFPARNLLDIEFSGSDTQLNNKMTIRTKMMVFDKEKIALLKKHAISSMVKDPTRVEVISAFIWKFMIDKCIKTKTVFTILPVNLRGRTKLNLENVFGNCFMLSSAYADGGVDIEFHALVNKLRKSIRKIDDDYITKSQYEDNYVNDAYKIFSNLLSNGEMKRCHITSWCRFLFYEVDYGFGTPILFYPVVDTDKNNTMILVNSKTGENIEAWVTMEQHTIEMLESQINLISSITTI